jgi:coenzyme PQQ biosynthesis protein PqqD
VINNAVRPRLSPKVRLRADRRTGRYLLLYPERGLDLSSTASDVLCLCTGHNTIDTIARRLATMHGPVPVGEVRRDVHRFLHVLADRGLIELGP